MCNCFRCQKRRMGKKHVGPTLTVSNIHTAAFRLQMLNFVIKTVFSIKKEQKKKTVTEGFQSWYEEAGLDVA